MSLKIKCLQFLIIIFLPLSDLFSSTPDLWRSRAELIKHDLVEIRQGRGLLISKAQKARAAESKQRVGETLEMLVKALEGDKVEIEVEILFSIVDEVLKSENTVFMPEAIQIFSEAMSVSGLSVEEGNMAVKSFMKFFAFHLNSEHMWIPTFSLNHRFLALKSFAPNLEVLPLESMSLLLQEVNERAGHVGMMDDPGVRGLHAEWTEFSGRLQAAYDIAVSELAQESLRAEIELLRKELDALNLRLQACEERAAGSSER